MESEAFANSNINNNNTVGVTDKNNGTDSDTFKSHANQTTRIISQRFYECRFVAASRMGILQFHAGHQKHTFHTYDRKVVSQMRRDTSIEDDFNRVYNFDVCLLIDLSYLWRLLPEINEYSMCISFNIFVDVHCVERSNEGEMRKRKTDTD